MLLSPPSLLTLVARPGGARPLCHRPPLRPAHVGRLAGSDLLHHLLHLTVLLQQLIDLLHARSRAGRDPAAARTVDHLGVSPLRRRHREDPPLDAVGPPAT